MAGSITVAEVADGPPSVTCGLPLIVCGILEQAHPTVEI